MLFFLMILEAPAASAEPQPELPGVPQCGKMICIFAPPAAVIARAVCYAHNTRRTVPFIAIRFPFFKYPEKEQQQGLVPAP
jgi:hypothetical protein